MCSDNVLGPGFLKVGIRTPLGWGQACKKGHILESHKISEGGARSSVLFTSFWMIFM